MVFRLRLALILSVLFATIPQSWAARSLSFAIIGDAGVWNSATKKVQDSIIAGQVGNLILPGDNLYDTDKSYSQIWSNWSKRGFRFSVVAIGNHTKGYEEEMKYFKMPGEYFSRTDGAVRFIVLNSDNEETAGDQANFLVKELSGAREQYVFVVYHHPSYTIGGHGWEEKKKFQKKIRPILAHYQQRITGIIVGHDHVASMIALNQTPLIVSGAVHESLPSKWVNYTDPDDGTKVKTLWTMKGGFYWTRLDIDGTTNQVWVNYVSATSGVVSCSMRIAPRPIVARPNCADRFFRY